MFVIVAQRLFTHPSCTWPVASVIGMELQWYMYICIHLYQGCNILPWVPHVHGGDLTTWDTTRLPPQAHTTIKCPTILQAQLHGTWLLMMSNPGHVHWLIIPLLSRWGGRSGNTLIGAYFHHKLRRPSQVSAAASRHNFTAGIVAFLLTDEY